MFYKFTQDNGLTVIIDSIPHVKSVTVGVWILAGSADETPEDNGIFHFMEHLMFKGTDKRDAYEIARALDSVGGQLNAFSSKEYTCYYAKVIDHHLPLALDILFDIIFNSLFEEQEIEKEKQVIIEEIKMYEDSPDELIHDKFAQMLWKGNALGLSILGSPKVITGLERSKLMKYYKKYYHPSNMIVSITGKVEPAETLAMISKFVKGEKKKKTVRKETVYTPTSSAFYLEKKDIEQVHFCLGNVGYPQTHELKYALSLLSIILGGGMSSRLFQDIREKRGLAYSVYSYQTSYRNNGMFVIYSGCSPKNIPSIMEIVMKHLADLRENGVTEEELYRAKEQFKGSLVLDLEDTTHRMTYLARLEIYHRKLFELDTILERIDRVTRDDLIEVANHVLEEKTLSLVAIGPVKKSAFSSFFPK